jgi:hypothetical protein
MFEVRACSDVASAFAMYIFKWGEYLPFDGGWPF